MLLGVEGLVADLRHLNPGRPGNKYDLFFTRMEVLIEESLVAADDFYHSTSHMSQWVSIKDLIKKMSARCPEKQDRREKKIVLWHFTATIHVGEPDVPISTGVRGRENIIPKSVTLKELDHDMHKSSLTPNVALRFDIPASTKSFVRGNVYYTVSYSVFQSSTPFRHGVMLCKIIEHVPTILMKYTNGETDQRNTLDPVKVASICLFKELDLDFIIAGIQLISVLAIINIQSVHPF